MWKYINIQTLEELRKQSRWLKLKILELKKYIKWIGWIKFGRAIRLGSQ